MDAKAAYVGVLMNLGLKEAEAERVFSDPALRARVLPIQKASALLSESEVEARRPLLRKGILRAIGLERVIREEEAEAERDRLEAARQATLKPRATSARQKKKLRPRGPEPVGAPARKSKRGK